MLFALSVGDMGTKGPPKSRPKPIERIKFMDTVDVYHKQLVNHADGIVAAIQLSELELELARFKQKNLSKKVLILESNLERQREAMKLYAARQEENTNES